MSAPKTSVEESPVTVRLLQPWFLGGFSQNSTTSSPVQDYGMLNFASVSSRLAIAARRQ